MRGDDMMLMPNKVPIKVQAIYREETEVPYALPGENIRIRVTGVDEESVSTGFVVCAADKCDSRLPMLMRGYKNQGRSKFPSISLFLVEITNNLCVLSTRVASSSQTMGRHCGVRRHIHGRLTRIVCVTFDGLFFFCHALNLPCPWTGGNGMRTNTPGHICARAQEPFALLKNRQSCVNARRCPQAHARGELTRVILA